MSSSFSINLLTAICRIPDGMIFAATRNVFGIGNDDEVAEKIIKSMHKPARFQISIDGSTYYLHFIIESDVVFITLVAPNYPKKLSFVYLQEVVKDFFTTYDKQQITNFSRPHAAEDFERKLKLLRSSYLDSQSEENMKKLNSELDLQHIHRISRHNFKEVLQTEQKLQVMENENEDKFFRYLEILDKAMVAITAIAVVLIILI